MDTEFKAYPKIPNISKAYMTITQKINGSNAQIYIYEEDGEKYLMVGSRNRWIHPSDDNYGFANFVFSHKEEFIEKLGVGRHFGEFAGPGINSGEGLKEKTLFLFNWHHFKDKELPTKTALVPVLYSGYLDRQIIIKIMNDLKENGSRIVPGYMKPEGIVINIDGNFYKSVFEQEEVAWNFKEKKIQVLPDLSEIQHLLQPLRLEKLLSKDEQYIRTYPASLPSICKDYMKDLEEEGQLIGSDDEIKSIKKVLGKNIFFFVKSVVAEKLN